MAEERAQRRLAAILAADVVGYSRLMGADEAGTFAHLKSHRSELLDPKIAEHRGRIVKTTGDGMLAEFASVVDALRCAVEIQRGMRARSADVPKEKRIEFRFGLNVGDIIIDGEDIYGDGVNIASRLEGIAEAGGICISARVYEDVRGKLDVTFEDSGEQRLKNIAWPVRVYRVRLRGVAEPRRPALALPDKPSVAVMPFTNLSSDREQDFFADAMTEEIISALSRIGELFVIARSSSLVYKNRSVRAEDAARELGVRYVLQGSVRAAGGRVRVTAQLIDGVTGGHAWSERYEGNLSGIFAVQDEITRSIAIAMQVTLTVGESVRLWEGQTKNLQAWEKMALAREAYLRFNVVENRKARRLLQEALELDPAYTAAMVLLGLTYWWDARYDQSTDVELSLSEAEAQAEQILELNPDMAGAFMLKGAIALLRRRHDDAVACCEKAVSLAPSDSHNMGFLGIVYRFAGQSEKAVSALKSALRLSPHNPAWQIYHLAVAYLWVGSYALAQTYLETYRRTEPDEPFGYVYLALTASLQGNDAEAAKIISALKDSFPDFGPANIIVGEPYKEGDKLDRVLAILSKADLSQQAP
jgi:adenylate cyclase